MPAASRALCVDIAFVFNNLPDWQPLAAAAQQAGLEVAVFSGAQDGLAQMADYLQGRSGVEAIHILSHGSNGAIELGGTWLNAQNIGQHSAALAPDGDMLVYGCYAGEGAQGALLLGELARLTQADTAASSNATGAAGQGDDWLLERQVGEIGTAPLSLDGYGHLLVTPSDQGFNGESPRYLTNAGETIGNVIYSMGTPTPGTAPWWRSQRVARLSASRRTMTTR